MEKEVTNLQQELQNKEILIKAQEAIREVNEKIASIKQNLIEKEQQILVEQAAKRALIVDLRKAQSLRRSHIRYCNQLQETYRLVEVRLVRKQKELERRFNPSSREMG